MFKRVFGIVSKDWAYTRRENILIYMVIMPLVLAGLLRLFLPSMEQLEVTIAIEESVPVEVREQLQAFGRLELHNSRESLQNRVQGLDDVPGIYVEDGKYIVLLEGNETAYIKKLTGLVLDYVLKGAEFVDMDFRNRGVTRSQVRELTAIILAFSSLQIGGLAIGLNVVNERETRTIRAMAVSPINTLEYVVGKSILALLVGLGLGLACTFVFVGSEANYGALAIAIMAGSPLALLIGFVMGVIANNQITAIAVVKGLFLFIIGIPLAAQFLPERLLWVAYLFPNYWVFSALQNVLAPAERVLPASIMIGAVYSTALLLSLIPAMRKNFRLG